MVARPVKMLPVNTLALAVRKAWTSEPSGANSKPWDRTQGSKLAGAATGGMWPGAAGVCGGGGMGWASPGGPAGAGRRGGGRGVESAMGAVPQYLRGLVGPGHVSRRLGERRLRWGDECFYRGWRLA